MVSTKTCHENEKGQPFWVGGETDLFPLRIVAPTKTFYDLKKRHVNGKNGDPLTYSKRNVEGDPFEWPLKLLSSVFMQSRGHKIVCFFYRFVANWPL